MGDECPAGIGRSRTTLNGPLALPHGSTASCSDIVLHNGAAIVEELLMLTSLSLCVSELGEGHDFRD